MQTTTTATKPRAPHRNFLAGDGSTPWLRLLPEDGWLTLGLLVVLVYTTIASIQGAWQVSGLDTLTLMGFIGLLFGYLAVQQGRLPGVLVHTVLIMLGILIAFKQTADAVVA
ncbi:MAG TPA: hypothetical protein VJR48_06765, partial [Ktedonobacterales bacterium]|nr:hypothetical protein [Ktedonobacterales bacterium]